MVCENMSFVHLHLPLMDDAVVASHSENIFYCLLFFCRVVDLEDCEDLNCC